jgi:hypothetical protein
MKVVVIDPASKHFNKHGVVDYVRGNGRVDGWETSIRVTFGEFNDDFFTFWFRPNQLVITKEHYSEN